ncbi:MAG TPA: hypothetical protein VJX95_02400 [Oscillospiraceae bacterium]|nr:hypothetical protein [Oscillospiraceae bacterium]
MKKRIVRGVSVLLVMGILLSFAISAEAVSYLRDDLNAIKDEYTQLYPTYEQELLNIVNGYQSDIQFGYHYLEDREGALNVVTKTLQIEMELLSSSSISPNAYNPSTGFFYSDYPMPFVEQLENNWCGPATIIQTLIGAGKLQNTTANKNYAAQQAQAQAMGTGSISGGTYVYAMTNRLNSYYTGGSKYTYKIITRYTTIDELKVYIQHSFYNNAPPIIYFNDASKLGYYYQTDGTLKPITHYISVSEQTALADTATLVDPNYMRTLSGVKIGGTHRNISLAEIYLAILGGGDGWIIYA